MLQKIIISRAINKDGTDTELKDIVGWYTPIAVFKLEPKSKYYILIFHDLGEMFPKKLFAQVKISSFNRIIKERNRVDLWRGALYRGYRVKYTGCKTFIPDTQQTITVEFGRSLFK